MTWEAAEKRLGAVARELGMPAGRIERARNAFRLWRREVPALAPPFVFATERDEPVFEFEVGERLAVVVLLNDGTARVSRCDEAEMDEEWVTDDAGAAATLAWLGAEVV